MVVRKFKVYASSQKSEVNWDEMSWREQVECMKNFVKNYKGTRVFEDFADYIGEDVENIIDAFCDAEAHGDISIPKSKQKDSDYANDDLY